MPNTNDDVLTVAVRPAEPSDMPFVFDSWRESYQETLAPRTSKERNRYRDAMRKRFRLLQDREAQFFIAVDPDDPDHILGYLCTEGPVVHYVYVKKAFRRQGIALQLLAHAGHSASALWVTHWSSFLDKIAIRRPNLLKYVGFEIPATLGALYERESSGQQPAVH